MSELQSFVSFVIILLTAALVVGVIADRLRIPYTVALLLAGLPFANRTTVTYFGPALFFIFLPALVFEAAWNLELRSLLRQWRAVTVLAFGGVALTGVMVGAGLYLTQQMPFMPALLLGSIVAATDPITVVATLKGLAVPQDLATIVESESLFNDAVAVVMYGVILNVMTTPHAAGGSGIIFRLIAVSVGGIAIGYAAAALVRVVMRSTENAMLQIVATLVTAFGSYLIADRIHASGILAAIISGIALRLFKPLPVTAEIAWEIDRFWSVLAFLANAVIFLLIGLRIDVERVVHEPVLLILVLLFVVIARAVLVYAPLPIVNAASRALAWKHVIVIAGMRGALSLALALALPQNIPYRAQIIDAVFGVVVMTLIAQGLLIGPLVKRLRLL